MTVSNPRLKLVQMIGDIGSEVGWVAVLPDDHPILVVTERGGPEPEGIPLAVDEPLLLKFPQELPHAVLPVKFTLAEIEVENDAELPEVLLDPFEDGTPGIIGKKRDDLTRIPIEIAIPLPFHQLGGQVFDVIPAVAALGKFHRLAQELPVAQENGFPQIIHLVPRVIDIVLAEDPVTDSRKNIRHDIADNGAPRMADMERSRGVGADEFHLDAPAVSQICRSVPVALAVDVLRGGKPSTLPG